MSASKEASETTSTSTSPLALPAPDVLDNSQTLTIDQTIRLDELGPMIVNSDGVRVSISLSTKSFDVKWKCNLLQTISRIANWKSMTPQEQERTIRVIGARNKQAMLIIPKSNNDLTKNLRIRLANEEEKLKASGAVDATISTAL